MSLSAKMIRRCSGPAPLKRAVTSDTAYSTPHRKLVEKILQEAVDEKKDESRDFTLDQSTLEPWQTRNRFRC